MLKLKLDENYGGVLNNCFGTKIGISLGGLYRVKYYSEVK